MDIIQTKILDLTMRLQLKGEEYKMLCDELTKLEEQEVDENDSKWIILKEKFEQNNKEIEEIKKQLEKLK